MQNAIIRYLLGSLLVGGAYGGAAFAQTPRHLPPVGGSCPGAKIVWVNTRSGIYHFQGESAADAEGDRPMHDGQ